MSEHLYQPDTAVEIAEIVTQSMEESRPLHIQGGATKSGWGHEMAAGDVLSTQKLAGIELYEPAELVLTAKSGTPMADIQQLLDDSNQQLAFEPPDYRGLFGTETQDQTFGGVLACNMAGPRRIQAGSARDHFLGFEAVSGRGETFKSGGRVVKNVTGFDLSKLMAGSFGTLAVMTSLSVKVLPRPEKTRTLLISGLDEARALQAMTTALQSPQEVNAAAYLPKTQADRSSVSYVASAGASVTAIRVEGHGPSVLDRLAVLMDLLKEFGTLEELHFHNSNILWQEIGNVATLLPSTEKAVWKISVPPSSAPVVVAAINQLPGAETFLDWGGGLIWLAVAQGENACANEVRTAVARSGGYATLLRASGEVKQRIPVFQPQSDPLAKLSSSLRTNFDPAGILNPERMQAPQG